MITYEKRTAENSLGLTVKQANSNRFYLTKQQRENLKTNQIFILWDMWYDYQSYNRMLRKVFKCETPQDIEFNQRRAENKARAQNSWHNRPGLDCNIKKLNQQILSQRIKTEEFLILCEKYETNLSQLAAHYNCDVEEIARHIVTLQNIGIEVPHTKKSKRKSKQISTDDLDSIVNLADSSNFPAQTSKFSISDLDQLLA